MKNKTKRIILIVIAVYALFAVFVSSLFYYMRNNPTDQVAMTYLWNDPSFEAQYGEIVHIGRNVTNRTEKSQKSSVYSRNKDRKNFGFCGITKV